jgi:hypothetical protein
MMAIAKVGDDAVSVAIEEVKPGDWADQVYKPGILNSSGKLYKKPGYNPIGIAQQLASRVRIMSNNTRRCLNETL